VRRDKVISSNRPRAAWPDEDPAFRNTRGNMRRLVKAQTISDCHPSTQRTSSRGATAEKAMSAAPIERPPKEIAIRPLRLHGRRPISRTTPSFTSSLVRGVMEDMAREREESCNGTLAQTALCHFLHEPVFIQCVRYSGPFF
jgi:hypothetical protein